MKAVIDWAEKKGSGLLSRIRNRHPFTDAVEAFIRRLDRWSAVPRDAALNRTAGVLVTPWLDTAVPMFCIEIALALRARGWRPVFLWDVTQLTFNNVTPTALKALPGLRARLQDFGDIVDVAAESVGPTFAEDFDLLVKENAIWTTKGEQTAEEFVRTRLGLKAEFEAHASRIFQALQRHRLDWVFVPGGVFGLSGLYVRAAQALDLDFTTFDSGLGGVILTHRGVAGHYSDLPEAQAKVEADLRARPEVLARIEADLAQSVKDRQESKDIIKIQTVLPTGRTDLASDILICLNYRADTAALCRTKVFPSVEAWIVAVIRFAKQHGNLRVNVRPHPVVRRAAARTTDDLETVVLREDPDGLVTRWIAADAPVSSYDLLATTKVVLPFTSTIGIEAVYHGKPVVVGSHVFYDTMGFVSKADTEAEYFRYIDEALAGRLEPTPEIRQRAAIVLYLALNCRALRTDFTPLPQHFEKWVQEDPQALWERADFQTLRDSLSQRQPLAWIQHQRKTSPHAA